MAETDILNPTRGWWRELNDNPNPSYGTPRRTANNNALARARMGPPYSRDTMNQGYAFEFYFLNRPWPTMLRLQHFYHAFKGGYFTYIDYDGGGRHHVGRFTSPPNAMQVANDKYVVQGLLFEEIQGARMLQYPSDFLNWSRWIYVVDDFLNTAVASYVATPATTSSWGARLDPTIAGASANDPSKYEIYTAAPGVGDYAQIQYVGWGFKMKFRIDATFGEATLYVDGVAALKMDLSTGTQLTGGSNPVMPTGMTFAGGLVTQTHMPLDVHRIKVVANGAGAGGTGCIFPAVQVIV